MSEEVNVGSLMRSLGIANKRIELLEKKLEEEKAKGVAYEQLQDVNLAMIAAIVRTYGEVKISQEQINDALNGKLQSVVLYDADAYEYTLRVAE